MMSGANWRDTTFDTHMKVMKALSSLSNVMARMHMQDGLMRRLLLIDTSHRFMDDSVDEASKSQRSMGVDQCAHLNVHLNSFYLQLRGALDNLAWALHFEAGILNTKDVADHPQWLDLFGPRFLRAATIAVPAVHAVLVHRHTWAKDLKTKRDPAAHRLPLYAPPAIGTEDIKQKVLALRAEYADAHAAGFDHEAYYEMMVREAELVPYRPFFQEIRHNDGAYRYRAILTVTNFDHLQLAGVIDEVLNAAGWA